MAMLRVDVDHAESWDEPSSVVRLLARAQAALRGEHTPAAGEHERLDLRRRPAGAEPAS